MKEQVAQIIEEKVKPVLAHHNGAIELVGVKDNMVEVKLLGACSGCPSAKATLEEVVLATIQEEIPEIQEVALVTEISDDLISMARSILNGK